MKGIYGTNRVIEAQKRGYRNPEDRELALFLGYEGKAEKIGENEQKTIKILREGNRRVKGYDSLSHLRENLFFYRKYKKEYENQVQGEVGWKMKVIKGNEGERKLGSTMSSEKIEKEAESTLRGKRIEITPRRVRKARDRSWSRRVTQSLRRREPGRKISAMSEIKLNKGEILYYKDRARRTRRSSRRHREEPKRSEKSFEDDNAYNLTFKASRKARKPHKKVSQRSRKSPQGSPKKVKINQNFVFLS